MILVLMSYYVVLDEPNVKLFDAIKRSIDSFTWPRAFIAVLYGVISFISSMNVTMAIVLDTFAVTIFYVVLALMYNESKQAKEQIKVEEINIIEEENIQAS
jgi:hypothetical protein